MGEVVAVLKKQCSISTTKPSPADERGRKGGGATKQMSKRNWQVSNTINFDILHHRQKRSEGFQIFSECCYQNTLSPPPGFTLLPLPYLQQGRPGAGWVRKPPNQALSAGKSPGYEKQTLPSQRRVHFPSESAVLHLHGPSGL